MIIYYSNCSNGQTPIHPCTTDEENTDLIYVGSHVGPISNTYINKKPRLLESSLQWILLVGWLIVFNVPLTARSFRDGTPFTVPCEGREAQ